ncbi:hypothetical protein ACHAW6_000971 [Cyclotella cf. meneghiniana]
MRSSMHAPATPYLLASMMTMGQWHRITQEESRKCCIIIPRNNYIMVLVNIDSNAILIKTIKNCNTSELIRAYDVIIIHL